MQLIIPIRLQWIYVLSHPGPVVTDLELTVTFTSTDGCKYSKELIVKTADIQILNSGSIINPNSYVYINNTPAMPAITAKLNMSQLVGTASWQFLTEYLRPNRIDSTPTNFNNVSAATTVNFTSGLNGSILGGKVTVTVSHSLITDTKSFVFYVRGYNPTAAQVSTFPVVSAGPWFTMALIRHESQSACGNEIKQFNPTPAPGPNWDDYGSCPNRGADPSGTYGWGIMQLTNPLPSKYELWDWKANINNGMNLLTVEKKNAAQTNWNLYVKNYNVFKELNPSAPPPPNRTEGCVVYSYLPTGNQRSLFDAVWIKRYNGTLGDYYQWNNSTNTWESHFTNHLGENYVNTISTQYCNCVQ